MDTDLPVRQFEGILARLRQLNEQFSVASARENNINDLELRAVPLLKELKQGSLYDGVPGRMVYSHALACVTISLVRFLGVACKRELR